MQNYFKCLIVLFALIQLNGKQFAHRASIVDVPGSGCLGNPFIVFTTLNCALIRFSCFSESLEKSEGYRGTRPPWVAGGDFARCHCCHWHLWHSVDTSLLVAPESFRLSAVIADIVILTKLILSIGTLVWSSCVVAGNYWSLWGSIANAEKMVFWPFNEDGVKKAELWDSPQLSFSSSSWFFQNSLFDSFSLSVLCL